MSYVAHAEYFELIENSLDPTHTKPEFYLNNMHEIYKSRDAHFLERLKIAKDEILDTIYKYFLDKNGNEVNWESQLFYLHQYQIHIVDNNDTSVLSPFHCTLLTTPLMYNLSYENFIKLIQNPIDESNFSTEVIKLNWKGQNNQLYSVIRQLKFDFDMIDDSFDIIAKFLKQSFTNFHSTKLSTIEKELKKDTDKPENLAKRKRIPVNPEKE